MKKLFTSLIAAATILTTAGLSALPLPAGAAAGPVLLSAVAQNTGGTSAKEAGDSVALTFDMPTNKFAVDMTNITNQLTLNNGHSFLDSAGNLGGAGWNASGTVLTLIISGNTSTLPTLATVEPGDVVTLATSTGITDLSSNLATGSQTITGAFTGQLTPTVTTAIHNAINNVVTTVASSTIVHDSVTVTGSGITPTGNVTLSFFSNGNCTNPVAATSSAMALSGGSLNASTFPQGPLTAGSYSFMASYAGDTNYVAATSSCEALTVTQNNQGEGTGVTITTQLSSNSVASNTPVTDSATLNNATSTAGGTVAYNAYLGTLCSGTPVFTNTQNVTNNNVPTSMAFTPTADGTYTWQAVYSGDANNNAATSTCGSEVLTVSEVTPPVSGTVKVHILKYIDGLVGSTTAPNGYVYPVSEFPMTATWQAANLNGGVQTSGNYSLGNFQGGSSYQFGADTSAMQAPTYYTTSEITNNIDSASQTVAADQPCQNNMFQLEGYTVSNVSFADAATKTPDPTTPVFSNLTGDMYVIVWNGFCGDNIGQGNGQHNNGNNKGNGTGDNQQPGNNNGQHGDNMNGITNSGDKGNNGNHNGNGHNNTQQAFNVIHTTNIPELTVPKHNKGDN